MKCFYVSEKTGVEMDYWNELVRPTREFYKNGLEGVIDFLQRNPLKKYSERFSSDGELKKYITDKNKKNIKTLDLIIETLNQCKFTPKEFINLVKKAYFLVYGYDMEKQCWDKLKEKAESIS